VAAAHDAAAAAAAGDSIRLKTDNSVMFKFTVESPLLTCSVTHSFYIISSPAHRADSILLRDWFCTAKRSVADTQCIMQCHSLNTSQIEKQH